MNKRTAQYLSHAENRIRICGVNIQLWEAQGVKPLLAEKARADLYKWIGIAQEQHQEDHF